MKNLIRSLVLAALALAPLHLYSADALTWQQQEEFMRKAKVVKVAESKKGVTGTFRVTLSDGKITHDASVQTIDERKPLFLGEVNFTDSYRYYVTGWKLAQMLTIADMVPPSIKRSFKGTDGSYTWWIDDVGATAGGVTVMDQADMTAKNIKAPNPDKWNQEMAVLNVYDQLIYNMDRNQTNIVIGKDWRLWMIDPSRAFRVHKTLKDPTLLTQIDRKMLEALKTLDAASLHKAFDKDRLASKDEINGLLARRDAIVKFFEDKGPSALFDRPARP
jgi:hypothetical protein